MGIIRHSCDHISGHHEPIHVKFGVWGFFIMFYWNMVIKMLKCKKENLMMSHFNTLSSTYMWCNQVKQVWILSNSIFILLIDCMHHLQSYLLQQTPLKLVNWFHRYRQLKGCKNNRKQRNYLLYLKISICKFHLILLNHITYCYWSRSRFPYLQGQLIPFKCSKAKKSLACKLITSSYAQPK